MKRNRCADYDWQSPSDTQFENVFNAYCAESEQLRKKCLLTEQSIQAVLQAVLSSSSSPPITHDASRPEIVQTPVSSQGAHEPSAKCSEEAKPAKSSTLSKLLAKAKSKQAKPKEQITSALLSATTERDKLPIFDTVDDAIKPTKPDVTREEKVEQQQTYEEFMKTQARAPRMGEIGITAADVEKIESLGYVMSGSRNPLAEKRIELQQRAVHEKQAAKQSLNFLAETDRRADERTIDDLFSLL